MNKLPASTSQLGLLLIVLIKLERIFKLFGLQKLLKASLLLTIRAYKQCISPYKGFNCAYRILHQDRSCSSYFQTCVSEQSLVRACVSFQQRLHECHQANLVLQSSSRQSRKSKRRRKRKNSCAENNNCFNCSDLFDAGLLFSACNPFECIDCGDCNF